MLINYNLSSHRIEEEEEVTSTIKRLKYEYWIYASDAEPSRVFPSRRFFIVVCCAAACCLSVLWIGVLFTAILVLVFSLSST